MSGIAGIVHSRGSTPTQEASVRRMVAAMPRRARDGTAFVALGEAVFGCAWLNATGENDAPVARSGDLLAVAADCRLDDREELMAALGIRDRSATDAVLLLKAYLRWDEDCVHHIRGDFAFAMWDHERRALFCARDHFGVRPFYYFADAGRFVFASEIRPVMLAADVEQAVNEDMVAGYLAGVPDDLEATSFRVVRRLPPGHTATFRDGHHLSKRRYWTPAPRTRHTGRDAVDEFRHLFRRSVENRLRGGSDVAAMLSGGLDSSSIACVASDIRRRAADGELRTYTLVVNPNSKLDESRYVADVLAKGGFSSRMIEVEDQRPFDGFEHILEEQEGVFLAPGLALTRSIYEAARADGARVILNGHGGDEVVSHAVVRLVELAYGRRWLELWREASGLAKADNASGISTFIELVTRFGLGARVARAMNLARKARDRIAGGPGDGAPSWTAIVNRDLARRANLGQRFHQSRIPPMPARRSERLHHRWQLSNALNSHAFEVLDKAAAAFGIEPRYPFWDKELVEFCLSLPPEAKRKDGWSRLILRRAMEGILPASVQWRRDKADFTENLVGGMIRHHQPMLDSLFGHEAERIAPYVDISGIRDAYERMRSNPRKARLDDVLHVWRSASLSIWLRQMEQRGAAG